ncbi:hypothetical protein ACH5RR_017683 [Cinchona calisaya]|uniref:Uncharacterized protein n=1 Tax=Cinchona calisaya TaxID=153742 RepID=A0ABD2ZK21_9GENT
MAGEDFEYDSHLWREDEIVENRKDLPSDIFFIEIRYRKVLLRNNLCPQERIEQPFLDEPMGPLVSKYFWVSKASMLVQYGAGADVLYDELASMGVPDYYIMVIVEAAYSFAKAMVADPHNSGREVLPMIIAVAALKKESMYETSIIHPGNSKLDMPSTKRQRMIV